MRLRRRNKKTIDITPEAVFSERAQQETADFAEKEKEDEQTSKETSRKKAKQKNSQKSNHDKVKIAKPVDAPVSFFRRMVQNPNFSSQVMVIIFSLLSDNMPMQRPLENMTSAIDKVRNISDVLNNTMQSVKVASEVPNQIRRLLK